MPLTLVAPKRWIVWLIIGLCIIHRYVYSKVLCSTYPHKRNYCSNYCKVLHLFCIGIAHWDPPNRGLAIGKYECQLWSIDWPTVLIHVCLEKAGLGSSFSNCGITVRKSAGQVPHLPATPLLLELLILSFRGRLITSVVDRNSSLLFPSILSSKSGAGPYYTTFRNGCSCTFVQYLPKTAHIQRCIALAYPYLVKGSLVPLFQTSSTQSSRAASSSLATWIWQMV